MHMVAPNSRRMQRVLKISHAATLCYVVATFYFGLRAHSLALISESGHNVSDLLAIGLSFRRRLLPDAAPPPTRRPSATSAPAFSPPSSTRSP
jgi:Co/Zn/Cd efflux system component